MRKHMGIAGLVLTILFILFPWIAGTIDIMWAFFTSTTITGIPWTSEGAWRIAVGFFWPFGMAFVGCTIADIFPSIMIERE